MSGTIRTLADGSYAQQVIGVDANGNVSGGGGSAGPTSDGVPGTPTVSRVAATTSSKALVAADTTRFAVVLWNDDTNPALVKYEVDAATANGTATTTSYTFAMPANTGVTVKGSEYTGRMSVISGTAGAGGVNVTIVN